MDTRVLRLTFTKSAEKNIKKQPKHIRDKVDTVIEILLENPFAGAEMKGNSKGMRKMYVGQQFRLLYRYENEELTVKLINFGPRGDVYK